MGHPRDDDIEARLLASIRQRLHVQARIGDRLADLRVDSLRLAGFVTDLEKAFDIRADQDLFDVETLQELAHYIREKRRERS